MTTDDTASSEKGTTTMDGTPATTRVAPPVDVFENDEELLLIVDMPGVGRESVSLRMERRVLTLSADRDGRSYARTFSLPDTVDSEGVSAEMNAGVLEVHLRKREDMKPRTITIQAR